MKARLIGIETTRYSAFFRCLLQEYGEGTLVKVDAVQYHSPQYAELAEQWCINEKIVGTRDFVLTRNGVELFGFHDHPEQLWAAYSELPFIERLAAEKIVRFKVSEER